MAVIEAIGKDKVGIRLSPFGVFNELPVYDAMETDYRYLAKQLNLRGAGLHPLGRPFANGRAAEYPESIRRCFAAMFKGSLILVGGYDCPARRERSGRPGKCDMMPWGPSVPLPNPDCRLAEVRRGSECSGTSRLFYTPGCEGLYRITRSSA